MLNPIVVKFLLKSNIAHFWECDIYTDIDSSTDRLARHCFFFAQSEHEYKKTLQQTTVHAVEHLRPCLNTCIVYTQI